MRRKKDDNNVKLFKQISQYGKNSGWRSSQVTSSVPYQATSPKPTGASGLIGSASGILDPPRKRPFIRPYNLSGLNYFNFGVQQLYEQRPQEKDKYDQTLENANDYAKYLARLMLNLRLRRGQTSTQGALLSHRFLTQYRTYQRLLYQYRSAGANRSARAMWYILKSMNRLKRLPDIPIPPPFDRPIPREPYYFRYYTARFRKRFLDDPPTPWAMNPQRPSRRWDDRFDYQGEGLTGYRWLLIRVQKISRTKIRKTFQRSDTGEIRYKVETNYKSLRRRQQFSNGPNRYRNQYGSSYYYRRHYY